MFCLCDRGSGVVVPEARTIAVYGITREAGGTAGEYRNSIPVETSGEKPGKYRLMCLSLSVVSG